jgi:hypothetical protein
MRRTSRRAGQDDITRGPQLAGLLTHDCTRVASLRSPRTYSKVTTSVSGSTVAGLLRMECGVSIVASPRGRAYFLVTANHLQKSHEIHSDHRMFVRVWSRNRQVLSYCDCKVIAHRRHLNPPTTV